MNIDMRSLMIVAAVTELLFTVLLAGTWSGRRTERSSLYWGFGSLCSGLSCIFGFLRGEMPESLAILGSNLLMFSALGLRLAGMRSFAGQAVKLGQLLLPAALISVLFQFREALDLDVRRRVLIAGIVGLAFGLRMLVELTRAQRNEPLTMRRIVIAAIAAQTLNDVVRLVVGSLSGFVNNQYLAPQGAFAMLMLNVLALYGVLNVACFMMLFERHETQLVRAATVDALTGLLNRAGFRQLAERQQQRSHHESKPVSVLVMDLDHFKRVNDRYGHEAGDVVLQGFARCARKVLRPTDLLSRPGGEEFWALLPATSLGEAVEVAQRICQQFRQERVAHGEETIAATVSLGVAEIAGPDETLTAALARADQALYVAKREGRDGVRSAAPFAALALE